MHRVAPTQRLEQALSKGKLYAARQVARNAKYWMKVIVYPPHTIIGMRRIKSKDSLKFGLSCFAVKNRV